MSTPDLGTPTPPAIEKTIEAITPDVGITTSGPILETSKVKSSILKEPLFWLGAGAILILIYWSITKRQNHVAKVEGQKENGNSKSNDTSSKPIAAIEWDRAKGPNERKSTVKFPSPNKRTSRRI